MAEKEAEKARRKAAGDDDDDDDDDDNYDSDAVLDPREKARRDKEKELQADLNNATELFGAAALGGTLPSIFLRVLMIYGCLLLRFIIKGARPPYILSTSHERGFPGIIQPNH